MDFKEVKKSECVFTVLTNEMFGEIGAYCHTHDKFFSTIDMGNVIERKWLKSLCRKVGKYFYDVTFTRAKVTSE